MSSVYRTKSTEPKLIYVD